MIKSCKHKSFDLCGHNLVYMRTQVNSNINNNILLTSLNLIKARIDLKYHSVRSYDKYFEQCYNLEKT
jgi:hypothetical protein